MSREQRGGGGEPTGGEVDFDAVLAGVIGERRNAVEQEVVKVETRKKSKSKRADIAGELGGHLGGLATKDGVESEQELMATAFNTLIYSEYHSKKIPEGVQTKLDAYSQAKNKHADALKKMDNLPDDFKGDPRLTKALDKLKLDMVAQARELAGELGVKYEEIAKGETALLATEDVEIARLREEADKLSPGKVEYAKESYGDYKERIVGVLADRMAEITQSKLEELLLKNGVKEGPGYNERGNQFKGNVEPATQEVIRKDEGTVKKGMRLLTEKELHGLFEKIDASEQDESKRRAAIAQLERRFGGLVGRGYSYGSIDEESTDNMLFLRSGAPEGENDAKMPNDLLIDAAYVESRIMFVLESFCINHGGRINVTQSGWPEEERVYRQMCFLRHLKADKNDFSVEEIGGTNDAGRIVRGSKKLDLDPKHDPTLTDLATKAGGIWEQTKNPHLLFGQIGGGMFGQRGIGYLDEIDHIPSELFREYAKIKKHKKGLTDAQRRESDAWNKELEKYLTGHEPTNQDIVDKATKPDGTIRLDKPETMKAMIAVLQEQGRDARKVGADIAEKKGEQQSEIYGLKKSLADMTRWKDQLSEANKTLEGQMQRSRGEDEKQSQALKSRIDSVNEEKQRVEGEKTKQASALRKLIVEAIEKLELQKTKGLPILGGAKELGERQRFIDDIKQRAGIK